MNLWIYVHAVFWINKVLIIIIIIINYIGYIVTQIDEKSKSIGSWLFESIR